MKFISTLKVVTLVSLLSFNVKAAVFFGAGVGAVDGTILEAGYKMNPFVAIRGRGTYAPSMSMPSFLAGGFEANSGAFSRINGVNYDSKTFDLGLEVTPIPLLPILSKFKLIGAIQYMDSSITLSSSSATAVIMNQNKFAPYLALGIDIVNLPIVSVRTTFGASIRSFGVQSSNGSAGDIAALNSAVGKNVIVPSASLTVRATIPFI